jgi:hypothetical protein
MIQSTNGHTITVNKTVRDQEIERARQEKLVDETKILQKVNYAHREAFRMKFPGQIEHVMRLTAERLQAVLTDKPTVLSDVTTWKTTPHEIKDLCEGLYYLSLISFNNPIENE